MTEAREDENLPAAEAGEHEILPAAETMENEFLPTTKARKLASQLPKWPDICEYTRQIQVTFY